MVPPPAALLSLLTLKLLDKERRSHITDFDFDEAVVFSQQRYHFFGGIRTNGAVGSRIDRRLGREFVADV